jgi:hypothetical protein
MSVFLKDQEEHPGVEEELYHHHLVAKFLQP